MKITRRAFMIASGAFLAVATTARKALAHSGLYYLVDQSGNNLVDGSGNDLTCSIPPIPEVSDRLHERLALAVNAGPNLVAVR